MVDRAVGAGTGAEAAIEFFARSDGHSAARQARAIFRARVSRRPARSSRVPFELVYDSFLAPAPAGLRSSWQVGWQGMYRAGNCSLDLRIEPELKSRRATVIGQITNHLLPEQDMVNTPVCLKRGREVVAETTSNRFGEFQMEYEQQGQLQLCVYLRNEAKHIQVALKKLATDTSGGNRVRPANRRRRSTRIKK